MTIPPKPPHEPEHDNPLEMLTNLGFGPDTVLMNDPKLFVDGRFLASLLVELQSELEPNEAKLALFQIGMIHGLRDAARVCREGGDQERSPLYTDKIDTTSLVMQWAGGARTAESGAISIDGCWPEQHEAISRCSRAGAASDPACWMSAGYTSGWLSGTLDRSLLALEVECAARGDEACRFEVREAAVWRAGSDSTMQRLLEEFPLDAFTHAALTQAGPETNPSEAERAAGQFDRSQPVVHIWGPVMVLPFTCLDEALGTVDMLGRDPGISEIRVVVVDLREHSLDAGFGAAALEQILETIESWDAQSLITGVSASSEAAIASLEVSHLVLRKDLAEAIATAFQIADAQKHQL